MNSTLPHGLRYLACIFLFLVFSLASKAGAQVPFEVYIADTTSGGGGKLAGGVLYYDEDTSFCFGTVWHYQHQRPITLQGNLADGILNAEWQDARPVRVRVKKKWRTIMQPYTATALINLNGVGGSNLPYRAEGQDLWFMAGSWSIDGDSSGVYGGISPLLSWLPE